MGSNEIAYTDLPADVKEVVSGESTYRQTECTNCGADLYLVDDHVEEGQVILDGNGQIRGDEAGWGGLCIEDPGALPRQLDESNGIYICGWCNDVDEFEKNGVEVFGCGPNWSGSKPQYGALILGTVIDNHYLSEESLDSRGSRLKEAFEAYATGSTITIGGESTVEFDGEVEIEGETVTADDVTSGRNPTRYSLLSDGQKIWVPESAIQ